MRTGPTAREIERNRRLTVDDLGGESERLRAFARDARALAYSGDCDACGATDELMDLVDKYGLDGP